MPDWSHPHIETYRSCVRYIAAELPVNELPKAKAYRYLDPLGLA